MSDATRSPWGETAMQVGECRAWRIGPLGFWIRRTPAEWHVCEARYDDEALAVAAPDPAPPDDAAWTRWATGPDLGAVRVRPIAPDRAVVVRPEQPFRILKRGSARIYVRIPVCVRIELFSDAGPQKLTEIPTVRLSNTWFGSLAEGELCYWTGTAARRSVDEFDPRPHLAVTPIEIVNAVEDELPLEKVCLVTAHLSFYENDRGLWTSEVRMTSSSHGAAERFEVTGGEPPEAAGGRIVSDPREVSKTSALTRTFGFMRVLPGIG